MTALHRLLLIPLLVLGASLMPMHAAEGDAPTTEPPATEAPAATDAAAPADDEAAASAASDAIDEQLAASADEEGSFITKFYLNSPVILGFLTVLAIVSLGIIMERFANLNRGKVSPDGLGQQADKLWQAGDYDGIKKLCAQDGSTLANAIAFCVEHRDEGIDTINEGAGEIASRDFRRQLQTNYWLAVVATLSPLLGLLGTITGMIASFAAVSVAGEIGDISMVAGGISEALYTTATGLIVAIPSLGAFHFFKGRVTQLAITLEDDSSALIRRWFGKQSQAAN